MYSMIVDYCARAGVKAVAFDVVYTEPSNEFGDDQKFGESIARSGKFISAVQLFDDDKTGLPSWPARGEPALPALDGLEAFSRRYSGVLTAKGAVFNIPEVDYSAAAMGNVIFEHTNRAVYRSIPALRLLGGAPVPSLGLSAYLAGEGIRSISYKGGDLLVGGKRIPLDAKGEALLRFRGPSMTHQAIPASAMILSEQQALNGEKPKIDPAELKGKYVVFGFIATGLFDLRSSPFGNGYGGMEIHATFLDNLLGGDFMRKVPLAWAILLVAVLASLAAIGLAFGKKVYLQAGVYALGLALPVGLAFGLYAAGIWFPLVQTMLAAILALAGVLIYNYATEGRQKAFIKGAFKQYLSPIVIEQLIANPDKLNLGGERRQLSIFFSDVQGFTSLSEALTPEELTSVLNEYLSAMTDIIQEEAGTVDKYEGDAIIAFWNAPLDFPDHGLRAVRAAIRCQEKLAEMRPMFKARTGKDLFMRVGLNSGPAVVGNMGSKTRFDYTMLGDAVNLAARLEGVNKQFGTYTMISANTLKELPPDSGFACRELSRIAVVGKKIPVTVYEPMRVQEFEARKDTLLKFADALALYYDGKFKAALAAFATIADIDPPAARYAAQCERLIAGPPQAWEGVWTMTEK
jgi:adenylate cyclase